MNPSHSCSIRDSAAFVSSYGGHGRAQIQQAEGLCQEGFCRAHGESLQHQSAYTEVVNWLISTHYIDPLGTWVPFKTLKAKGVGWRRGTAKQKIKKSERESNKRQTIVLWS